jgi:hypothetical protein
VILPILSIVLTSSLAAQTGGSGTLEGTVTDPSGAVIPGATVTATHAATGVDHRRSTTAAGLFVFNALVVYWR